MSFFEKNQAYLKKIKAAFVADNEKTFAPENDAVYTEKDGHYLAERNNVRCFVQSKYSVSDEMESMFATIPQNAQCIILFGCGCGDAVQYALTPRNFPELETIIIIEPSSAWASTIMNEMDLEETWGERGDKIIFVAGYDPDKIGRLIASRYLNPDEEFLLAYHLSTRALFPEYYQKMTDASIDFLRNIPIMLNTNKNISHMIFYNEVLNLSLATYNYTDIMEIFKGKNVIIVSAGPSLEKNIHLLETAKKKAVVVAVGSAVRILDGRWITPHFRAALDPAPEEYIIFSKLKDKMTPLIYSNALYAEISAHYQGALIRANTTSDDLSIFLHKKRNLKMVGFPTGPTIANLTAEIFCAIGCKSMVFVGQDMCMYNYHLHADSGEYLPYKNLNNSKSMLSLKDIHGNEVVAPRNYYLIKQCLESTVNRFKNKVEFINATEGGLGLSGVPNKTLAEVLAGWEEDDIVPVLEERLKKIDLVDFQDEIYELKEKIGDIDRLNDENLKNLQKAKDILLKDEQLLRREKYIQTFKEAQKNEKKLKEIDWYREYIHPTLEGFLQAECLNFGKDIDNDDEKIRFRAILEIQLRTAQATKSFIITLKAALKQVFAEEVKVKTFSLIVKGG